MPLKLATLTALAASPAESGISAPEEEEYYSSWSLFLVCLLLILSLWTSYYLQIKRIRAIHETLVSVFAGMFVGLIVRLAPGTMIRDMLVRATLEHRNGDDKLTQFLQTFRHTLVLVWIWASLGLESLDLTLLECLTFGSTLSATDPVTILAIFQQYKVDPKLYSVIFGESLLNDAVSIVMYQTLSQFHGTEVYLSSIFHGLGIFLLSFTVSLALGVCFGLGMSLILKHSSLHLFPSIESCLIPLCAYTCYFFSTGLEMSGIVSLLFCGITLKHYAYHTMSQKTQRATKYLFSTLARLSENFIFIYLGISLFTSAPTTEPVTSYVKPLFIAITTVAVVFTRYVAVFPLSEAINLFQKHARGQRTEELPHSYQMMLFWAGLRGAVGVALAAGFQGKNAQVLRTTVLVVVVFTVLLFGGTTARMLEVLGIRTVVDDEAESSDDDDLATRSPWLTGRRTSRYGAYVDEPSALGGNNFNSAARSYNHQAAAGSPVHGIFSSSSSDSFDSELGETLPMAINPDQGTGPRQSLSTVIGQDGKWFQALDERYLLPIFSNATASRTFHARRARRTASGNGGQAGGSGNGGLGSGAGTPRYSSEDESDLGQEIELGRTPRVVPRVAADESRTERGLPSPALRSNSFNGEGRIS
ncbi:hypothetical protein C0991_004184 [Blastosporella zonata]|nr:hypothetical protein C0991_004184 [Blastosporella zonata]